MKFRTILLLSVLFAGQVSAAARTIEVQGHRGARARLPENTLPGFQYALGLGVDVLEMDLAVTKDGVLVLSHDPHVNPEICLDPSGKKMTAGPLIHSLTLAEVQSYDCGSLKNPKYALQQPIPKTKIPTLQEVFDLVKASKLSNAKTVRFNIETKIKQDHPEDTVSPQVFAKLLVDLIQKNKLVSRAVIQSFDFRTLVEARRLNPKIKIAALIEDTKIDMVRTAEELGAEIISPRYTIITADVVKSLQKKNVKVIPWTANTEEDWKALVAMGVDGIISDDPEALIAHLKKK
jgi:glycerophosphoryl diester phosphodiesterase